MRNCFTFSLLTLTLWAGDLENALQKRIAAGPGKVFLAAKNLKSGQTVSIRGDDKVRTASTIKLPILVEVYAQAAEGKLKLDEKLVMNDADIVSGSGVIRELGAGTQLTIAGVANVMIVVSDNTATNMLIGRISADAVNARMDKLGLPATKAMRKVRGDGTQLKEAQGWSKAGLLEENRKYGLGSSTPMEMVRLLEMLDAGKLPGSKDMIAILKRQQYQDGIGRKLKGLSIANKTGSLDHLRSDVGIVYTPSGPIAIAITVEDIPVIDYGEDNPGLFLIADLSKLIVDSLGK
jgi:beta-lactamase class A